MKTSTSIILILVAVGLTYTFVMPQYQKSKALRAEAQEYENVLDNVNSLVETRDRLLDQYQDFPKSEVAKLAKVLPDNTDVVRLAKDLDSMAARYGISIKNIQVAPTTDDNASAIIQSEAAPTYQKSTITVTFLSDYPNFKRFVADIEKGLRITDIRSVSFQTGESGIYEYRISIDTYWLK